MQLYLVRHGETIWNATRRCQGHTDVPLSERGRAEAAALAERLASVTLDAAYASDLQRASETARIIAAPHGLAVSEEPALREIRLGDWEGLHLDELAARYPESRAAWLADPGAAEVPGGETLTAVQARVVARLAEIVVAHRGHRVLVVGHGFATLSYLCHVLELPLRSFRTLWLDNVGLTIVQWGSDGRRTLRCLNDTSHTRDLPWSP